MLQKHPSEWGCSIGHRTGRIVLSPCVLLWARHLPSIPVPLLWAKPLSLQAYQSLY